MPFGLGSLLGAGGSLLGGLLDGDGGQGAANAANNALMRRIEEQFKALGAERQIAFRDARIAKEGLLADVMGDLDRSVARIEGGGRETKRSIVDRGKQTQASLDQNLASRGLNSSTIAANAQRGVAADTSRGLSAVDSAVNQQLAGISGQRAGFRSALGGDLSELPIRNLGFAQDQGLSRVQFLNSITNQAGPRSNGFSNLFGQLGGLIGENGVGGVLDGLGGLFN